MSSPPGAAKTASEEIEELKNKLNQLEKELEKQKEENRILRSKNDQLQQELDASRQNSLFDVLTTSEHVEAFRGFLRESSISSNVEKLDFLEKVCQYQRETHLDKRMGLAQEIKYRYIAEIGRAVQQECRDRSRMPSSA
eukprot:TRINITY_DN38523_c0_g1_i1.p1 TRINITY_DN38523_c0_g1~~TRINITY_DN38523_c0_g1_i1.p1  ORF type:complete len:139 (-),score=20.54 TRINITY_DN38523_c0_g1_i1:10-426(-)